MYRIGDVTLTGDGAVFGSAHSAEMEIETAPGTGNSLTTAPGSGLECDECHAPIEREHVECRCIDTSQPSAPLLRLHQWCHYARLQRGHERA